MSAPEADRRVTLSIDSGVAHVTLNRPQKRNALSIALVTELSVVLARIANDREVRVVALEGTGPDFCAGADLAEVAASQHQGPEVGLSEARELGNVFARIRRLPQPVVAVVRGRALGGGCGLAAACDIVLAHEAATFGFPEVRLGFVPALVMAVLKRKVGEAAAFDLVVRGHRIGAAEAAGSGLITRVVSAGSFRAEVLAYLGELATRPPLAIRLTKQLFHGLDGAAFEEALARGAEVNAVARLTGECRDGVRRFLHEE
ncbi:MAG: enoyl-CoA hydratase/isomerase family protein [Gemmatimonadetes bacterium]|nr:enoyl-CoA hydratase/isomerase family protein [Gemmatimonadota bacterium]